jgi:hypothetical protein
MAGALVLAAVVLFFGGMVWLALRWSRRPPVASDLRRADDAEAAGGHAPTVGDVIDEGVFGWTRPYPNDD